MLRASTAWSRLKRISRAEKACHSARCGWSGCHGRGIERNSMSFCITHSRHVPRPIACLTACCMRTWRILISRTCSVASSAAGSKNSWDRHPFVSSRVMNHTDADSFVVLGCSAIGKDLDLVALSFPCWSESCFNPLRIWCAL
jgi:hypothetical protein